MAGAVELIVGGVAAVGGVWAALEARAARRGTQKLTEQSALALERSADYQERATDLAEREAGPKLRVRWNGRAFKVTNNGKGTARLLAAQLVIGDWNGEVHRLDLLVPPASDPSTPPTGWAFDFPADQEPPEELVGEGAQLAIFAITEAGKHYRGESESFRLLRSEDGQMRFRAWG